ncbi:MAG: type II toxin-antitoxin system VapC family toxin [Deltaproteobacteria bacterium]|nr:type II toxin-antitoxin system VapC family toxin [Deltaproteobacteria bacterium]
MKVVLDASVGIMLAVANENKKLQDIVSKAEWVFVPHLYGFEIANTIWKYAKAKIWQEEECETVLQRALSLPDEYIASKILASEALALAQQQSHSAYDMFYLVLARRYNALLATLDKKLAKIAATINIKIIT